MEPATVDRIDHGMSVLASVILNSAGGKKGGGQFSPKEMHDSFFDFHQSYDAKEVISDPEAWSSFKQGLIAAFRKPK